ncbi:MAG: alpha/beta hydrolase [Planctomycetota bacterium]|nr:alpha/beta hydrolase [Planctomycetota bacterium]MDA1140270.1 alpha/beta hydrolase [Planctomycetota bacterium]
MTHKALPFFLLLFTSMHAEKKTLPSLQSIKGAETHSYKIVGDVELRLFLFKPAGHKPEDSRPAAVFFFGGGWNGGTPTQFEEHSKYLASRGMIAGVADYRVNSRHQTTPFECVKDGKSAVRWLRTNAKTLGIDPNRIAAGGGSAGGHVAAATGTTQGLEEEGQDLNVSSIPNALLLFNPVYDNGPDGYGYSRVKERWQEISPMHNIRTGAPPTIVFLGTNDNLIPVATAKNYKKKMEEVGSRCDLHLYENQAHGFFNTGKAGGQYYRATVSEMDKFLISLGWLEGEPTIKP